MAVDTIGRTVTIRDLDKFTMFADAPGAPGKRSRLVWCERAGNPRIAVFTSIDSDSRVPIQAAMNPETFFIMLQSFEKVVKGPVDVKVKIENSTAEYDKATNKPSGNMIASSETWFGKDANGVIWIAISAANRPRVKFEFKISDYHKFYHPDGTQFTEAQGSELQALATIDCLRNIYYPITGGFRPMSPAAVAKAAASADTSTVKATEFDDIDF